MTVDIIFTIWTNIIGVGFFFMIFASMASLGLFSVIFDRYF